MATTYYDTVNGRLRGQVTSGVRTGYLTDALGSVTATVQSAAVVNTYRYKPYGAQLAKTGVGADPRFGWQALQGARRGPMFYVAQRHFNALIASFSSSSSRLNGRTPYAGPIDGRHFASLASAPGSLRFFDADCYTCKFFTGSTVIDKCLATGWTGCWSVSDLTFNGWIIQAYTRTYVAIECCTFGVVDFYVENAYEAWKVINGKVQLGKSTPPGLLGSITFACTNITEDAGLDRWEVVKNYENTFGGGLVLGDAKLFTRAEVEANSPDTWSLENALPTFRGSLSYFDKGGSSPIHREMTVSHSCCKGKTDCQLSTSTSPASARVRNGRCK